MMGAHGMPTYTRVWITDIELGWCEPHDNGHVMLMNTPKTTTAYRYGDICTTRPNEDGDLVLDEVVDRDTRTGLFVTADPSDLRRVVLACRLQRAEHEVLGPGLMLVLFEPEAREGLEEGLKHNVSTSLTFSEEDPRW